MSLLSTLEATLSPDPNLRVRAEVELANLTATSTAPGFVLKKYVKEWWSPFFQTFKGPFATSVEAKVEIRGLLFSGLSDPIRKIRTACAVIISDIAHPDWPDDWTTLMDQLLQLIAGPPVSVEGGMRVLNDFVGIDLTEDQLLPIARQMLPQLLNILGSPQTHSATTRARAILIFRQCVMTLFTVKDEHPEAVKAAIGEILPQWLDAFRQLLEMDVVQELAGESWDPIAIRIAIFQTLEVIVNSFPSTLKTSLAHFVTLAVSHLSSLHPLYHAAFVSNSSDVAVPPQTDEDSSVSGDLPTLLSTVLDFVGQACRRKALVSLFVVDGKGTAVMDASLQAAILYGKMTTDDEESWASDPNAFVADEDDEAFTYNVRAAALDFAFALVDTFEIPALASLWSAFESQVASADASRASSDEDWWKGYESALAIVASASSELLDHTEEQVAAGEPAVFDLGRLFTSIVPTYLGTSDLPFLQGRAFVFASAFSRALPVELANQYIDAATTVLEQAEASIPVKVSAIRALETFLRHLGDSIDPARANHTLSRLVPLLPQTTENTLVLVIDSVRATLKVAGPVLDSTTASQLVKTVLTKWFESPEDPLTGSAVCELFEALASVQTPAVISVIVQEALPALATLLGDIRNDPFSTTAAASLDLLDNIFAGLSSPLPQDSFVAFATPLFEALAVSEDRDIIQSALSVLTAVVRKDVQQLLTWRDATGRSGLELVLAQVARMLNPVGSEAGGLFVGDLVIHLIRTAGADLGPVLPGLLKAFVTRLATAETASFSQSLILPFAYLIHTQTDTVLSLLETIEVPATSTTPAQPALEVLLSKWSETVDVFQGFWNLKVSTVALAQLFSSQRPSVQKIQVKGDLLLTASNTGRIMTRARTKNDPTQFPPIPFPAKALKILLHDIQNAGEEGRKADAADAESDDGDDEWADDGAEFLNEDQDLAFFSDMLGADSSLAKYMNDDSSDVGQDQSDEDLKDDPVYQLDLQSHLLSFFRRSYETDANSFRQLVEQYLTASEKEVLAKCFQAS